MTMTSDDIKAIQSIVLESEKRLEQRLTDKIDATKDFLLQENRRLKNEIVSEITEFIDGAIIPQIDDHETRISKLETAVKTT